MAGTQATRLDVFVKPKVNIKRKNQQELESIFYYFRRRYSRIASNFEQQELVVSRLRYLPTFSFINSPSIFSVKGVSLVLLNWSPSLRINSACVG